ncbi:DUF3397 family protein [Shouchella patagoniensis]|uniref:DUF3397 family protein n=1 Tax=Shouchella patagoniensis TaxID=228576 RepID=UPI0009959472
MIVFFSSIVAMLVIAPPVLYILLFLFLSIKSERPIAGRKASDCTAPFFLISIVFMANELWPLYGLWISLAGMVISICCFLWFIHWVNPKAPIWTKAKAIWRLCFLTSAASYMFILIVAIVSRGILF